MLEDQDKYEEFYDFVENLKLEGLLHDAVCSNCEVDECDDCPGYLGCGMVANQIYGEALDLINLLANEWIKQVQIPSSSKPA